MCPPTSTLFTLLGAGVAPWALAHWNYNQLIVDSAIAGQHGHTVQQRGIVRDYTKHADDAGGGGVRDRVRHRRDIRTPGPAAGVSIASSRWRHGNGYDWSGGWARMHAAGTLATSSWAEPDGVSWAVPPQAQLPVHTATRDAAGYIKNYTPPSSALWPPGMKEKHVVKTFPPLEEEKDDE
ncbi:hypothetical protein DL769_002459 [Monosporascus sp. CRB-8-3]|nr:hypothetical protein DL769_002459 [Monosporascus sp. CRB-8-3]